MDLSSTGSSSIKNDLDAGEVFKAHPFHCCVCSEPLNPGPIFQCINEHRTCSTCHDEGPKKCFVCSLPITQRCLSLEVVLECMSIPQNTESREMLTIFGPCTCSEAGCNFRSDFKDFATHFNTSHLFSIRPFLYGMMYGTVIERDEETIILQELDDCALFVIKNKLLKMGNSIMLYHFTPFTLNMEFSFDLTAIAPSGKSYYLRGAKARDIQHSSSFAFSTDLLIPYYSSQPSGGLTLEVTINKIGAA